jgi:hypothetical protein
MVRKSEIGPLSASIDRLVRARIAEIMSAAGVDQGRIGVEVLFELPPSFVRAYEELWRIATGEEGHDGQGRTRRNDAAVGVAGDPKNRGGGAGGRLRDTERSRERYGEVVVRSGGSSRRAARGASRGGGAGLSLGPEEALRLKERIDKRLRAVARDIAEELSMVYGVDLETGEVRVKVDMDKVGSMRAALQAAAEGRDDASTIDD